MFHPLPLVSVVLMALTASPAKPTENPPLSVRLPLGVADAKNNIGYVPNDKDGVDAIDLTNGETLWQTKEATRPLFVLEKSLVVWTQAKDKPHEIQVLLLDTTAKGKKVLQSDAIVLPDWVGFGGNGHSFTAQAEAKSGEIVVTWQARAWYAGGAAPSPQMLKNSNKNAAGAARINVETGKVETVDGAKMEGAISKLPEGLQKLKSHQYWTGSEWKTTPLIVGDVVASLEIEGSKDQQKAILKLFDLASGKEKEPAKLLEGKALWPQASLDGRHLLIHQGLVKEQLPDGDFAFWIFELETGKQVGKVPFEQTAGGVAVCGDHALFLVAQPKTAPKTLGKQGRWLKAINLITGKTDWEHTVESDVNLPPVP